MTKKSVAVVWHQKMEEIEAVTPVDLLRRAGFKVVIFSADNNLTIVGSHHIKLQAEAKLQDLVVNDYDALVLVGGPGVDTLLNNGHLQAVSRQFNSQQKLIGAVCASPQVLGQANILAGLKITHYPGANKFLEGAIDLSPKPVVIERNIITSAGPGTAFAYSLALIEYLADKDTALKIKKETIYHD